MSKKDYIAAAQIVMERWGAADLPKEFRSFTPEERRMIMKLVAQEVEDAFVEFFKGGRFDEQRFREACNP